MKSLFEITNDYQRVVEAIEENGGALTPEQETFLTINREELETKAVAYTQVIKNREAIRDAVDEEIKRLTAIKKGIDNATERLRENIKLAMQTFEIDEIKTPLIKINFRKSESVIITDVEKLPADCVIITKSAIGKTELKARIKQGEEIPGCHLVENLNLQIK